MHRDDIAARLRDDRFWLRVWPRGDCWEWRGAIQSDGYGHFVEDGSHIRAHTHAYSLTKGRIPPGMTVHHLCYHRWCVRPSHLMLLSAVANVMDGNSPAARQARQTHCKRGHPLVPHLSKIGQRDCRICAAMRRRIRTERETHDRRERAKEVARQLHSAR